VEIHGTPSAPPPQDLYEKDFLTFALDNSEKRSRYPSDDVTALMYNGNGGDHDVDQDRQIDIFASAFRLNRINVLMYPDKS
jgi:hypothetical protein